MDGHGPPNVSYGAIRHTCEDVALASTDRGGAAHSSKPHPSASSPTSRRGRVSRGSVLVIGVLAVAASVALSGNVRRKAAKFGDGVLARYELPDVPARFPPATSVTRARYCQHIRQCHPSQPSQRPHF